MDIRRFMTHWHVKGGASKTLRQPVILPGYGLAAF